MMRMRCADISILGVGILYALLSLGDAAAFLPCKQASYTHRHVRRDTVPISGLSSSSSTLSGVSSSTMSNSSVTRSASSTSLSSFSSAIGNVSPGGTGERQDLNQTPVSPLSMSASLTTSSSTNSTGAPGIKIGDQGIASPGSDSVTLTLSSFSQSSTVIPKSAPDIKALGQWPDSPSSNLTDSTALSISQSSLAALGVSTFEAQGLKSLSQKSNPALNELVSSVTFSLSSTTSYGSPSGAPQLMSAFRGPNTAPSNPAPSNATSSGLASNQAALPSRSPTSALIPLETASSNPVPLKTVGLSNLTLSHTALSGVLQPTGFLNTLVTPNTALTNPTSSNTTPRHSTITGGAQLVMIDGQTKLISSGVALSGMQGPNAVPYTSAECKDWLGHPLPCSCPGAYSSNDYSSVIAIMTSSYLNTNANPPASTTETMYATVGPAAQVPGDNLCGQPCLIDASEVQMLYWPVMAAAGNLSAPTVAAMTPYTLVSDGFTFTSPSVYVAYRSLKASAAYEPFGLPIGGRIHDVTVGYPPEAISTSHCNMQYTNAAQAYQPINYTMLEFPPPNSAITDCAHVSGVQDVGGSLYNPSASNEATNPFFSMPGPLNWVDPLWSSCLPVTYGVYDPPRKLDKTSNMVAPTLVPVTIPAADTASPAAVVTPTTPPLTAGAVANGGVIAVQPASALVPSVQELGATSVSAVVFGPSATVGAVSTPLPVEPAATDPAPVVPVPIIPVSAGSAAPAPHNSPVPSVNDPGTVPVPVVQTPASVVETPSYNSVLMATPNSIVAAASPAPVGNTLAVNQPAVIAPTVVNGPSVHAPVVEGPAVNDPAVNTLAVDAPAANAPMINAPTINIPTANKPVANTPGNAAPAVNAPASNAPAANAPGANVPVPNIPAVNEPIPAPAVKANNRIVVASPSPVVIAGNTAAPAANGGVVIASSTYLPGSHATVGGNVVSVGTNNIVQDGAIQNIPQQAEPTPVLVGSNSIQAASGGGVIIAGSTYQPGQQAQVAGTPFSVGPSNIIVGSSTHAIPNVVPAVAATPTPTPVLVGGNSIANAPGGGVVIASSTYQPGVQAQVSGTPISVGTDNIVVDSSTLALPKPPLATPVLVAGQSIVKAANGGVVIASSTYLPGAVTQISETPISVGIDTVLINNKPYAFPTAPAPNAAQDAAQALAPVPAPSLIPILVGSQSIVKGSGGGIVVGSSTVVPGAQTTIQGHVVIAGTNNVIIDGNNYALPSAAGETLQQQAPAVEQPQRQIPAQVGEQPIARASNGGIMIGTSTLNQGAQVTISGTVVSAGATNIALGGITYALPSSAGTVLQTPAPQSQPQLAPVEIAGNSIARASDGGIVIGTSTIASGSQAFISGIVISAGATNVALGSNTYSLASTAGALLETPAPQISAPAKVAGNSIVRASNGGIIFGGSTLALGSQTTIFNEVVSAGFTAVAIDGSTYALPTSAGAILQTPAPPNVPVLVAGQTIARASNGGLLVGSSTIAPGAEATIAGHTISAASSGSPNIAIDGINYAIPVSAGAVLETPAPTPANTSSQPVQAIITLANGAIISAGGPTAVVSGTTCTVLPNDSGIILGSKTIPLPPLSVIAASTTTTLTIASVTFVACSTGFPIASITSSLSPGGPACTIAGTLVSLGQNALQVGSTIMPLPTIPPETFTVADQIITAAPTAFTVPPDTTVLAGSSAVTLSGTIISLGSAGLLIGSSTTPLDVAEIVVAGEGLVAGVSVGLGSMGGGVLNGTLAGSYGNASSLITSNSPPTLSPSAPTLPSSSVKIGRGSRVRSELWAIAVTGLLGWVIGVGVFAL
ncbi:hypothetical protein N7G274_006612 [Stereocaulon virgatum]|uniref:Uncharacterized protein n=1 Tax=Stereocaulon virgatum TaxID=373712 RepID=A0ABR4A4R0_9LECA